MAELMQHCQSKRAQACSRLAVIGESLASSQHVSSLAKRDYLCYLKSPTLQAYLRTICTCFCLETIPYQLLRTFAIPQGIRISSRRYCIDLLNRHKALHRMIEHSNLTKLTTLFDIALCEAWYQEGRLDEEHEICLQGQDATSCSGLSAVSAPR